MTDINGYGLRAEMVTESKQILSQINPRYGSPVEEKATEESVMATDISGFNSPGRYEKLTAVHSQ